MYFFRLNQLFAQNGNPWDIHFPILIHMNDGSQKIFDTSDAFFPRFKLMKVVKSELTLSKIKYLMGEEEKRSKLHIFSPLCQDEVRQAMVEWILTCYYIEILLIHSNGSISNGSSSIYWPLTPTSFC